MVVLGDGIKWWYIRTPWRGVDAGGEGGVPPADWRCQKHSAIGQTHNATITPRATVKICLIFNLTLLDLKQDLIF